ncbi:MAG TPA: hypothetical protein VFF73_04560 [Planctomycetota bacterium]|nr:hypothetical protein [Planctomycetota bacterium]
MHRQIGAWIAIPAILLLCQSAAHAQSVNQISLQEAGPPARTTSIDLATGKVVVSSNGVDRSSQLDPTLLKSLQDGVVKDRLPQLLGLPTTDKNPGGASARRIGPASGSADRITFSGTDHRGAANSISYDVASGASFGGLRGIDSRIEDVFRQAKSLAKSVASAPAPMGKVDALFSWKGLSARSNDREVSVDLDSGAITVTGKDGAQVTGKATADQLAQLRSYLGSVDSKSLPDKVTGDGRGPEFVATLPGGKTISGSTFAFDGSNENLRKAVQLVRSLGQGTAFANDMSYGGRKAPSADEEAKAADETKTAETAANPPEVAKAPVEVAKTPVDVTKAPAETGLWGKLHSLVDDFKAESARLDQVGRDLYVNDVKPFFAKTRTMLSGMGDWVKTTWDSLFDRSARADVAKDATVDERGFTRTGGMMDALNGRIRGEVERAEGKGGDEAP